MLPQKTQQCLFLLCEINGFNIRAALRTTCVSILDRSFSFSSIGGLHIWPLKMGFTRLTRWCVKQDMWVGPVMDLTDKQPGIFISDCPDQSLCEGSVLWPTDPLRGWICIYIVYPSICWTRTNRSSPLCFLFALHAASLLIWYQAFYTAYCFLYLAVLLFFTAS